MEQTPDQMNAGIKLAISSFMVDLGVGILILGLMLMSLFKGHSLPVGFGVEEEGLRLLAELVAVTFLCIVPLCRIYVMLMIWHPKLKRTEAGLTMYWVLPGWVIPVNLSVFALQLLAVLVATSGMGMAGAASSIIAGALCVSIIYAAWPSTHSLVLLGAAEPEPAHDLPSN